jgi:hypothetical protein
MASAASDITMGVNAVGFLMIDRNFICLPLLTLLGVGYPLIRPLLHSTFSQRTRSVSSLPSERDEAFRQTPHGFRDWVPIAILSTRLCT